MDEQFLTRAKRKDGNGWVYGFYVNNTTNIDKNPREEKGLRHYIIDFIYECEDYDCSGTSLFSSDFWEILPETVGRYTGLEDNNNVKTFVGDLIKTHYANAINDTFIEQVVFYKGQFMAYSKINGTDHLTPLYNGIERLAIDKSIYMDRFEVIGNIYDNPEMMI